MKKATGEIIGLCAVKHLIHGTVEYFEIMYRFVKKMGKWVCDGMLMREIESEIKKKDLTQVEAAEILEISQPRLNNLPLMRSLICSIDLADM